jgi:hypothetical protein
MPASLRMLTRRMFGAPRNALLNRDLMAALRNSMPGCDTCRDIEKDVESTSKGGEYVESAGFQGRSVQTLDAHFRAHWKDAYELVEIPGSGGAN